MISFKEFGVVKVTLMTSLVLAMSSCYAQSNDTSKQQSDESSEVKPQVDLTPQQYIRDLTKVPVENKMEDLLRRIKDPNYTEIAQKVLKEKSKFRSMVKKCSRGGGERSEGDMAKYGAYGEILLFPTPLEPGIYLIGLRCTVSERYNQEFRFFTYTDNSGISLEQFEFTEVWADKGGKLSFKEIPEVRSSDVKYDPSKKELFFVRSCYCSEMTLEQLKRYKFDSLITHKYENGRFILSGYWEGDLRGKSIEEIKIEDLKQLYP